MGGGPVPAPGVGAGPQGPGAGGTERRTASALPPPHHYQHISQHHQPMYAHNYMNPYGGPPYYPPIPPPVSSEWSYGPVGLHALIRPSSTTGHRRQCSNTFPWCHTTRGLLITPPSSLPRTRSRRPQRRFLSLLTPRRRHIPRASPCLLLSLLPYPGSGGRDCSDPASDAAGSTSAAAAAAAAAGTPAAPPSEPLQVTPQTKPALAIIGPTESYSPKLVSILLTRLTAGDGTANERSQLLPLPWLSKPDEPFPVRTTKSRRRRRILASGSGSCSYRTSIREKSPLRMPRRRMRKSMWRRKMPILAELRSLPSQHRGPRRSRYLWSSPQGRRHLLHRTNHPKVPRPPPTTPISIQPHTAASSQSTTTLSNRSPCDPRPPSFAETQPEGREDNGEASG